MELLRISQQTGYEVTHGISVFESQKFYREFIRLKQDIVQNAPSPKLLALLNEIEYLYRQGNPMLAERKLKEATTIAEEEGIIPNLITSLENPEDKNPVIPEDTFSDTLKPKVPEPTTLEETPVETPEKILTEAPELREDIGRVEWRKKTYKDVSDDIGATFQHATPLNELETRIRVPAHESGHVLRAVAKALVNRRKIEKAYFVLKWKVDYRHHRLYLVGGEARMQIGGKRVDLRA